MSTGNYPSAGQPEPGTGNHAGIPSAPARTPSPADSTADSALASSLDAIRRAEGEGRQYFRTDEIAVMKKILGS